MTDQDIEKLKALTSRDPVFMPLSMLSEKDHAALSNTISYVEKLEKALKASDEKLRFMRHRDARWEDDDELKAVLSANKQALAEKG